MGGPVDVDLEQYTNTSGEAPPEAKPAEEAKQEQAAEAAPIPGTPAESKES